MTRESLDQRDPLRELVVAITFFGALAGFAWHEGVFTRLGDTATILGLFAVAFVALTAWLDRDLRAALLSKLRGEEVPRQQPVRKAPAKSPGAKRVAT